MAGVGDPEWLCEGESSRRKLVHSVGVWKYEMISERGRVTRLLHIATLSGLLAVGAFALSDESLLEGLWKPLFHSKCSTSVRGTSWEYYDIIPHNHIPPPDVCCPVNEGDLYRLGEESNVNPFQRATHVFHRGPLEASPSHSVVGVVHCLRESEQNSAWYYRANGSDVFVDVGVTISFRTHREAMWHFLGVPHLSHLDSLGPIASSELAPAASKLGYDSIQITAHADLTCGKVHPEIIMTRHVGTSACAGPYYSSPNRTRCECSNELPCASCR